MAHEAACYPVKLYVCSLSCCDQQYCLCLSDVCCQLSATVTMSLWLLMSQCCASLIGCTWSRDIMHRNPQQPACSNHSDDRASNVTVQALAEKESDGMAKMIYRKDTGDILGVHIFGLHAADLIHEASNAMATHQRVQVCLAYLFQPCTNCLSLLHSTSAVPCNLMHCLTALLCFTGTWFKHTLLRHFCLLFVASGLTVSGSGGSCICAKLASHTDC